MEENKQVDTLKEPMALGEIFAKSGLFPDIKSQAQAAVKILAGRELGLTPFESMTGIYFVNNRMALLANIMASLIKRNKKYDYIVKKLDDTECVISIMQKENGSEAKEIGLSTFTFKDAAKAGLVNKDNWKNYPRNMLFSRALANGVRWFAPDAVCGYQAYEEMDDLATEAPKNVIEITADGEVKNGQA